MAFIKVDRDLKNWKWFTKENMLLVWMYLLTSVYYKDGFFEGVEIKKGQVPIGRKSLAEKLHISEQQARTCVNRLKSTGEITTKSTNKFTVITIVKWANYQYIPEYVNQQNNQVANQQATNEQPTSNQQSTTIKELKEQIELKESFRSNYTEDENQPYWLGEELEKQNAQEQERVDVWERNLFEMFEDEFARPLSQLEMQRLSEWMSLNDEKLITYALREAIMQKVLKFDYIDRILIDWKTEGITVEEYEKR